VLYGGGAEVNDTPTGGWGGGKFSDRGARVRLDSAAGNPRGDNFTIPPQGRPYLPQVIWGRAHPGGLAFKTMITDSPADDLGARLRRSEKKKRQLQRRIKALLGED